MSEEQIYALLALAEEQSKTIDSLLESGNVSQKNIEKIIINHEKFTKELTNAARSDVKEIIRESLKEDLNEIRGTIKQSKKILTWAPVFLSFMIVLVLGVGMNVLTNKKYSEIGELNQEIYSRKKEFKKTPIIKEFKASKTSDRTIAAVAIDRKAQPWEQDGKVWIEFE